LRVYQFKYFRVWFADRDAPQPMPAIAEPGPKEVWIYSWVFYLLECYYLWNEKFVAMFPVFGLIYVYIYRYVYYIRCGRIDQRETLHAIAAPWGSFERQDVPLVSLAGVGAGDLFWPAIWSH